MSLGPKLMEYRSEINTSRITISSMATERERRWGEGGIED